MSEYPQLLRFFATNASIRVLSVFSSAPSALNVIDDAVGDASEGVVREMGISRDDREEISSLAHLHACIIVSRLATHAAASRNTARNVHRSSGFNQLPQNQRHFLPQDSSHPSSRLHMEHFGHLGSGTDRMLLEVDEAHSLNTVEGKDRFHLNFDLVDSGALPLLLRLIRSSPSSLARALAILSICTELGANFSKPQLENLFIKSHILKNLSHLSSLSDERIRAYVCLAYSRLFHLEGNMVFLDDVDCRNPKLSETQPRRGKIMMANNASETVMDPSLEDQGNVLCNLIRLASTTKTRATRQHSLLCLKRYTSLYIKSGSAKSSLFESFAQRNSSHVTITQSTVAFDDTAARAITGILHLQMRHNRLYVDHRHLHAYFKPGGAFCTRASESSAQEKSDLFPFPSTVDLPSAVAVDDGSTLGADTANDHTSVCPSLPFNNAYNTLNILHNLTFRLGYHDKLVSASQCIPELILALDPLIEFVMSHSFVDKAEHHHAATRVSAGSRSSHQSTRESIFSSHDDAFFANFFPFTSPTPYTYSLRYYIAFFKQSRSLPHAKALSLSLRTGKERSRDLGGGGGGEATTVSPISMPVYMPPWLLALQSICNLVSGSKGSHSPVIEQGGLQKLVQILYDLLAIGEVLVVEEQERETEQGRGKAGENGTSEGEVEGRSELQTICLSNYKAVMRDPTQRGEEEEEAEEEGNLRQAVDWHRALILDSVCSAIRDLLINLPVEQAGMHVTLSRVERREERENLRTFGWGEGTLESGSSTGSDSAERRGEAEKHGIKDYERNYEHNHERGYEKRNDKKEGGARLDGKRKNVTAIDLDKEMEMRGENETICTPSSSSSLRTRIFVDLKGEKGELGQLRYIREHVWIGQALLRAVSGGAELRALRSSCCLDIMTGLATLSSKRDFAFGSHGCPTYLSLPCNALSVTVRFSQEPFLHLLHPQSLLSSQPPLGYAEAVREGCLQMEYAIKENKFRERGNTHGTRRGHRSKHQYRQSGATGSEVARPEVTLVSQSQHINSGSDVDETEDQDEGSVHVSKTNCTNPVYSSHFSELGGSTDRARFSSPHYSSRTERRRTEKTITKTNRKRSMQTAVLRRKSLVRTSFSSSSSFPPPSANTGVQQEDQNQNEYMKIERKACVSHHQSPSSSTISDIRRAFHQDEGNKAEIVDLSNVRLAEAEWESQKKKRKMRMGAALSDFRKVVNRRSKRVDTAADAKSSLPGDSLGQGSGPRIHKKRWMFDELASLRALIHRPRGVNDVDTRYLAFVILINMTQKVRKKSASEK